MPKRRDIHTIPLGFTCAHQGGGAVCGLPAVPNSQFCVDHQPEPPAVHAEAPLAVVAAAMVAIESDLFNANVLDQYAKRQFGDLEDKYDEITAPDGSVVRMSTLTVEDRATMEGEAREHANVASRIRSRCTKNMLEIAKLGLLVGTKGATPHEAAARKMREMGADEATVAAYRAKHALPSAEEDGP